MNAPNGIITEMIGVLCTCVGILLLYAGIMKLRSIEDFKRTLILIPYFHHTLATKSAAMMIIVVEIIIGMALVFKLIGASLLAALLFASLTVVALIVILKKQSIACNCFGKGDELISRKTVIRNCMLTIFMILSVIKSVNEIIVTHIFISMVLCLLLAILNKQLENQTEFNKLKKEGAV